MTATISIAMTDENASAPRADSLAWGSTDPVGPTNYAELFGEDSFSIMSQPKFAWKCALNPMFAVCMDQTPNRFHRWMQRLAFGFKWERLPE